MLKSNCKISEITSEPHKKRKHYTFRITSTGEDEDTSTIEAANTTGTTQAAVTAGAASPATGSSVSFFSEANANVPSSAARRRRDGEQIKAKTSTSLLNDGGKVAALAVGGVVVGALTAGIGLIAGMMVVGLGAAAGGSVALSTNSKEKEKQLVLACETLEDAEAWVNVITNRIRELSLSNNAMNYIPSHITQASRRHMPPAGVRLDEVEDWMVRSDWRVQSIKHGIRLFGINRNDTNDNSKISSLMPFSPTASRSGSGNQNACMKVNMAMSGSATEIFMVIMNMPPMCRTGCIKNHRIVETIDNYTDIVHITLDSLFLNPTWTSPRDMCLLRYWRHNSDGSYVICLDSTVHEECPLVPGVVRAHMNAAYVIIPPKEGAIDEDHIQCLVSFAAQMNPRGWIWSSLGYRRQFLTNFMLHVIDIRDAVDIARFVSVQFDLSSADESASKRELEDASNETGTDVDGTLGTTPPPYLNPSMWAESDASGFKLRGRTYCQDKIKATSAKQLFKLIAIDLFEVIEPTPNICAHPRNRVFKAMQRGDDDWVFVVNIMVPGPPFLSFVAYFKGDRAQIDSDTPFGRIARPFFDGNDDEFRNNRFKLIPRVLDGNMVIKMAVKDTPTLIGNKLKQYYFRGDNYFEVDIDVGSSSVARNVVGLAIGYSKAIVVDIGFCLQGNEEHELPEVLLGGCTCVHIDTTTAKKL